LEGDVKDLSRAYELSCIIDQVHDFASSQHRAFVIKHLEPWLQHAEECEVALFKEFLRLSPHKLPADPLPAEWYTAKEVSKEARNAKAANTRKLKKIMLSEDASHDTASYPVQTLQRERTSVRLDVAQPQAKRGRGRPRKQEKKKPKELGVAHLSAKQGSRHSSNKVAKCQPKRRRGRPKKSEI
jgi:hypothetical protein